MEKVLRLRNAKARSVKVNRNGNPSTSVSECGRRLDVTGNTPIPEGSTTLADTVFVRSLDVLLPHLVAFRLTP